jgi:hypothetical protein
MKNLFAFLAVLGMLSFGASIAVAQEDVDQPTEQAQPAPTPPPGNS